MGESPSGSILAKGRVMEAIVSAVPVWGLVLLGGLLVVQVTLDVIALLDHLKIKKTAIVGWSDGAIIGLDIAMKHPERVSKLFAFAANSDPSGVADIASSDVFNAYIARAGEEYKRLSPTPTAYQSFVAEITKMWESQPKWTAADLAAIKVPTWIVDGDHDEAIKRENTEFMAANIPGAGLLIQPQVSHFSFLQDPEQFTDDVLRFLERGGERSGAATK